MKTGIYVWDKPVQGKRVLKKESYDSKDNAGMAIVKDILVQKGLKLAYVGVAEAHKCDYVLVSMCSDADWWRFIRERVRWGRGDYKVIVGGPACLNVRPFLEYADYFVLGRAEGVIGELITEGAVGPSVIASRDFNPDHEYKVNQVKKPYGRTIRLSSGSQYKEGNIGCPYKCYFCGYTWHRKFSYNKEKKYSPYDEFCSKQNQESAVLDFIKDPKPDFKHLRTTALDGLSERIRFLANKRIRDEDFRYFLEKLYDNAAHRQIKLFNIVGYPTETEDDWFCFLELLRETDKALSGANRPLGLELNNTPFRAFPGTPMACSQMSYRNYRGLIPKILGREYREKTGNKYRKNTIYSGKNLWANDNGFTQSLSSSILAAIVWRGEEKDAPQMEKVALSKKFQNASCDQKVATLEKYFDVERLFGAYTPETLPTRYLRSYAKVEKMW